MKCLVDQREMALKLKTTFLLDLSGLTRHELPWHVMSPLVPTSPEPSLVE